MNCQLCQKNLATVHITDLVGNEAQSEAPNEPNEPNEPSDTRVQERHVCAQCAKKELQLTITMAQPNKAMVDIWKYLHAARQKAGMTCPDCGMTLAEFRSKGRLGCPKDYEVFWPHLAPLLERVHNAVRHTGRVPGQDDETLLQKRRLTDLRGKLELAIQEEAYEAAAQLRDEIQALEEAPQAPTEA